MNGSGNEQQKSGFSYVVWTVAALFFCAPIGIPMMWIKGLFPKTVRIGLSAVLGVFWGSAFIKAGIDSAAKKKAQATAAAVATAAPVQPTTAEVSPNPTEPPVEAVAAKEPVDAKPTAKDEAEPEATGFWDSGNLVVVEGDRCPEGWWSLFKGEPDGADEFARRENEKNRKKFAAQVKRTRYVVVYENGVFSGSGVKIGKYDFKKQGYPVELPSTLYCRTNAGHVTLAFTPAKAVDPAAGLSDDGKVGEYEWNTKPFQTPWPVPEAEAKERKRQLVTSDLRALVAFEITGADLHEKYFNIRGQGRTDLGAGRLIKAKVIAVRVEGGRAGLLLDTAPSAVATAK